MEQRVEETIRRLQSLLSLPSGCENCWADLHQGCSDACRQSSRQYHEKRKTIADEINALVTEMQRTPG